MAISDMGSFVSEVVLLKLLAGFLSLPVERKTISIKLIK
jgi:hypothetical protein